jgi:DNA-binding GntR family transcriptional regulator
MARLTDTQLVILSSASRRHDRGVDLPTNVTGEAVRKAVDKLIRTGLLEEVHANGSLLAWRRDTEAGPMALRITQHSHLRQQTPNTLLTSGNMLLTSGEACLMGVQTKLG